VRSVIRIGYPWRARRNAATPGRLPPGQRGTLLGMADDQSPEVQRDRPGVDPDTELDEQPPVTGRDPAFEEAWRKVDAQPLGIPEEQRPDGDPTSA
jgi:hypothetical protein